ncbi:MAG: hypothetical protein H6672_04925 [Anaerolineaceae bacterium]|nr:hypothetical protein [Anaerolineaceae bacterium]
MTWDRCVNTHDVGTAFAKITEILSQSPTSLYIIVDLRSNPAIPAGPTLKSAFFGPYRDPKLEEWLIISSNRSARMIEKALSSAAGRHNVRWFETEDEAMIYLENAINAQA